jgi:hypothetical protein
MENQNVTTPDPITNQQRVLVRNTVTGFEQSIAGMFGLLTAGPLGALASWGAIRGLQGKWAPWAILGIPAAPVLIIVQAFAIMAISPDTYQVPSSSGTNTEQVRYYGN